ncbi:MAG: leucine-rich repeat domain-containing protein, partial [Acutalibacteraceae bacterium]|nr:leucine-rich repeat domain-containing protein [Acutalibacteraceae bacterium]
MKKAISVIIASAMILSVTSSIPLSVSAVETENVASSYSVTDVGAYIDEYGEWTYELADYGNGYACRLVQYKGNQHSVKIPETIAGYSVAEIGDSLFANNSNITDVVIPESIVWIGDSAFSNCTNLDRVYYTGDDNGWFNMPICMNNNPLLSARLFINASLQSDYFGTWVYEAVNEYSCVITGYLGNKSDVVIPDKIGNMTVTEIADSAFANHSNLSRIVIPESITLINTDAFLNCNNLSQVYYTGEHPEWYSITGLFSPGNEALSMAMLNANVCVKTDDYGAWIYSVETPENTCMIMNYFGDSADVQIPDEIDGMPVTTIWEYAFADKSNLTSLIIPKNVTYIFDYAFSNCNNIRNVYYTAGYNEYDNIHLGYNGNESVFFAEPHVDVSVKNDACGTWVFKPSMHIPDSLSLIDYFGNESKVVVPGEIDNKPVAEISANAFASSTMLRKLVIPKGVKSIETGAFINTALDTVYYEGDLSDWNRVSIGWENDKLFNATINFNTCVKNDACGTWICEETYEYVCITDYFGNADKVVVPNEVVGKPVTEIGAYVFADKDNLTNIIIPKSVNRIREFAFSGCNNIRNLYFTGDYSEWCNILWYAGNDEVRNMTPYCDANVVTDEFGTWVFDTSYGDFARIMDYYGNASELVIPSEIDNKPVAEIERYLFENNSNLTSIIIPDSIQRIGESAFSGCDNINTVYYTGSMDEWHRIMIEPDNDVVRDIFVIYDTPVK